MTGIPAVLCAPAIELGQDSWKTCKLALSGQLRDYVTSKDTLVAENGQRQRGF